MKSISSPLVWRLPARRVARAGIILTCVATLMSSPAPAQVIASDSLALVNVYNRLGGPHWGGQAIWLSGPVGSWYGVSVADRRVVGLDLSYNGLVGSVPTSLYDLTHLEVLSLAGNFIEDVLLPDVGQLERLKVLKLFDNRFFGTLPVEIGRLGELRVLELAANDFSGPLPPEIGDLALLETLDLFGNEFTGPIPLEMTRLANLSRLFLSINRFTGPIPPEMRLLTRLEVVRIEHNLFTGSLPPELAELQHLRILDVSNNRISGTLPAEWSALKNLQVLWMYDNQLTGPIPEPWSEMHSLFTLQILNNPLSGTLPLSFARMVSLQRLNLSNTNICIPDDVALQSWLNGLSSFLSSGIACIATSTAIREDLPEVLALDAPFPNPARGRTTLRFGLPAPDAVDIAVHDVLGRQVLAIASSTHPAGWHRIDADLSVLPAGTYVVRLRTRHSTITRPLIVLH